MKRCSKCGIEKSEDDFSFKNVEKGILQCQCKQCHQEYTRSHYADNKSSYIDRAKKSSVKYRDELRQRIRSYLKDKCCLDCGESDPNVLDFDHRDQTQKESSISRMITRRLSWENILREMSKCDIRCANCHRRRTAKQFGWSKSL